MSKPVVSLRNVDLYFHSRLYHTASWRDVFVGMIKPGKSTPRERLHICKNISFDIHRGDRIALVGTNGAGKTSLCRCIAGFYRPTSGEIKRHGKVRALFEAETVIQPELTGRENAWLLAKLLYPGEEVTSEIEQALDFSELGRFLDAPLRTYSKGMLARLGLSLAALKPADLLILDEVFEGADIFFREKISRRMTEVMARSGAVIFISHSPEQIRRVCNRLLHLHNGEIVYDGKVEEGLALFQRSARPAAQAVEAPVLPQAEL